ncbi:catalase [Streptomyces sp. NPDC054796]
MPESDGKQRQRGAHRANGQGDGPLTTDQGVVVGQPDGSVRAGERGPTLLEDFHFREKLTHFGHERIPERVVHARGSGAYGYFEPYESCAAHTRAAFLRDPAVRTPVFVRFSTAQGPRGSADTVRDSRGFAVKFYTSEGNFDLVGSSFPVFFVQDGIKFPDFVHAFKGEPDSGMPTGASAHDTLWDFVSLQPETLHAVMWLMSDRALPRSYRMMPGYGVHTFRLVDAYGNSTFCKFHWKPLLGVHSLVWDEAQECQGRDPDFHRRDLWEAIASGEYPEWELGVQLVPEEEEFAFDFDLLDPTKVIPEEQVPVQPVGRMVLDRNPDNFFAETEQVAFHAANVVPGIGFTDDPLLQARLFSYMDTQLNRLGGPNFAQLPVNKPLAPVRTTQRDGRHQYALHSQVSYTPHSLGGGCPAEPEKQEEQEKPEKPESSNGVFLHHPERLGGTKTRRRSGSFADHCSQAALFWHSVGDWERRHIVEAFRFELGRVGSVAVRERMVARLGDVDSGLARAVAEGVGVPVPEERGRGRGPSGAPEVTSPALGLEAARGSGSIRTRRVAVLVADGVDARQADAVRDALKERGAVVETLGPRAGEVHGHDDGSACAADRALPTVASVLYDAVLLPGGSGDPLAPGTGDADDHAAARFVRDAYRHGKPVAALGSGIGALAALAPEELRTADDGGGGGDGTVVDHGVVTDAAVGAVTEEFVSAFADAIAAHRHWGRPRMPR